MKREQSNEMNRRGFLKRTVLAGAAICIAPTLEKVTAAERAISGKSATLAHSHPSRYGGCTHTKDIGQWKGGIYRFRNGVWLHGAEP